MRTLHNEGRIVELDGVRALAIGAVFLHHAFKLRLLWMGVDLFFVLSGFLITGILLKQKTEPFTRYLARFYERRARRILPPYILLLVVTTLLLGTAWMQHAWLYVMGMNIIRALSLPRPQTLEVLWSLAVEEQFYLVWPLVVFVLSEAAVGWVAAASLLLVPVLRGVCTPMFAKHWAIFALTPFRMDLLLAGALLALACIHRREAIRCWGHLGLGLTALAGVGLVGLAWKGVSTTDNTVLANVAIYELSLVACVGVMLWALSGRGTRVLTLAPVVYLGRISYTVYLIHVTGLYVAAKWVHGTVPVALLGGALTLGYAAASWRWMERPLLGERPKEASVVLE